MSRWTELSIQTTATGIELIANLLTEAGAGGVVLEDLPGEAGPSVVTAYFPEHLDVELLTQQIAQKIVHLQDRGADVGTGQLSINYVLEADWEHSWKAFYKPTRLSAQITVLPTWESYTPQAEHEKLIRLDPGMAFGTGTHLTTQLSVQALEKYLKPGMTVIDAGCGSGILSIAAAKLGASHVLGLDNDEIAVRASLQNVQTNQLATQIEIVQNNLLDGLQTPVDLIVANILAEVIISFAVDVFQLLKPGGIFIASGIIASSQHDVEETLKSVGFDLLETKVEEHWVTCVAGKAFA